MHVFIAILILTLFYVGGNVINGFSKPSGYHPRVVVTETPTVTTTPTETAKPTPQRKVTARPTQASANGTSVDSVIVDGKTSWTQGAPDDRMATADELFEAGNNYRRTNSIPTVARNDTLCSIAQNRANELLANGQLDGHAGFEKYAREQKEFDTMDEILFGGAHPQLAVHIVEWGWDKSKTGHKDALQDRALTHGCGGIVGYFAVFIFGGGHVN